MRRPLAARALALPLVLALLAGCAGGAVDVAAGGSQPASAGASASAVRPAPSEAEGLDLQPLAEGTPAKRDSAGVAAAFDATAATELVSPAPQIDYEQRALLCLFLGTRSGRWTLDLQTVRLNGTRLEIEARERPPRVAGSEATTPAACATVRRPALPTGSIRVSAHDTVSDEFITDGAIVVPPPSGGS
jgi:hypothetical protein